MSPDSSVALVLFLAQCCIILLFLNEIHRRWWGTKRRVAWIALAGFEAFMLVAYLTSFTNRFAVRRAATLRPWLGVTAIVYLATSAVVLVLFLALRPLRKHWNGQTNPVRRRMLELAGNALMCSPVAAVSYGSLIQRTDFEVREIDVPMPGLPAGLDGVRILHLSDIHLSPFLSEKELARVIDATLGLHPHIAFVTGDLITSRRDPLDACIRQLARVKADAGVYGCLGNHERYAHAEDATAELGARAGIRFLRQESEGLRFGNATLNVAGVDFQSSVAKRWYLWGAEHLVQPGAFNLLLSHNPDVFPTAVRQGYDLVLAGHTHGGQINIEILGQSINPARFHTPYVYGLYCQGRSVEYVTRGIGTIGVPIRLGAPPEVALLRLRKA